MKACAEVIVNLTLDRRESICGPRSGTAARVRNYASWRAAAGCSIGQRNSVQVEGDTGASRRVRAAAAAAATVFIRLVGGKQQLAAAAATSAARRLPAKLLLRIETVERLSNG